MRQFAELLCWKNIIIIVLDRSIAVISVIRGKNLLYWSFLLITWRLLIVSCNLHEWLFRPRLKNKSMLVWSKSILFSRLTLGKLYIGQLSGCHSFPSQLALTVIKHLVPVIKGAHYSVLYWKCWQEWLCLPARFITSFYSLEEVSQWEGWGMAGYGLEKVQVWQLWPPSPNFLPRS